jgi:hypothetical protein
MPDQDRPGEQPDAVPEGGQPGEVPRGEGGEGDTARFSVGEPTPQSEETTAPEATPEATAEWKQPAAPWSGRAAVPMPSHGEQDAEWYPDEPPGSPWWMPVVAGVVGLMILAVLGVGVWLIAQALSGDPAPAQPPSPSPTVTTASPTPSPTPGQQPSPTRSPTPSPSPTPTPTPTPSPTAPAPPTPTGPSPTEEAGG